MINKMPKNYTKLNLNKTKLSLLKRSTQFMFVLITIVALGIGMNRFVNRSRATEEIATVTFIPKNKTVKKDETFNQSVQIATPDKKISAVDLTLNFDRGYLEYSAQSDNLILKTIPPNYFTKVVLEEAISAIIIGEGAKEDELGKGRSFAKIVLIANKPDKELVNNVVVSLSFSALKKTSGTKISLNKDLSMVVGTTGPSLDHTFTLDTTNAFDQIIINDGVPVKTTVTPKTTITPETTVTAGPKANISVKIMTKLQGIESKPKRGEKLRMNVNFYDEKDNKQNVKDVEFVSNDSAVYTATISLNKFSAGSNFKLFIKGPMHVQKRFCHKTPTGRFDYNCTSSETGFQLVEGENIIDLTNVPLLAGDLPLPQNSILNAQDIAALANCIYNSSSDCINKTDVNYDGVTNANDFAIVTNSMAIKYDDEY